MLQDDSCGGICDVGLDGGYRLTAVLRWTQDGNLAVSRDGDLVVTRDGVWAVWGVVFFVLVRTE